MRRKDWALRLVAYLAEIRGRPFAWGRHDCALFAAGAVEAMTGTDFAAGFRGRYSSARGAQRVLRKAGFADHVEMAAGVLPARPPRAARPGDVAVVETEEGPALGIVQGAQIYVVGPSGLTLFPLGAATAAFEV